jgi:hypothetical protein
MSWFSRLRNWQTDQANGIGIRSDYHDQEDNNFALGINECINYAGLNPPIANIPWGGFQINQLGAGTLSTDACTVGQSQTRTIAYAADSGTANTYVITPSPAITSYVVGQQFTFSPGSSNTTACTLNVSGLGAKPIKKDYNADPAPGDLTQNQMITVVYDGTNFQMVNAAHGLLTQNLSAIYAADGGGSDSYSITLVPSIASYSTGLMINFKANTANTGAASLNINGLGAKTIVKDGSLTLNNNDIKASQIVQVIYDGTNFQMISPTSYLASQDGHINYAADIGVNDTYVITVTPAPPAYVQGMVFNFKANTLNTGASSLNVNSLGPIAIKKFGTSTDTETGDILAGQIVSVIYDGTNFQMISAVTAIHSQTNWTTPIGADELPIYDSANSTNKKVTLINLVNGQTTDSTPDNTADYVMTYDASASTTKKALGQNIGRLVLIATNTSSSSATSDFSQCFSAAYSQYMVEFINVVPATDATQLYCIFGTGATPTWSNSGYNWSVNTSAGSASNATAQAQISLTGSTAGQIVSNTASIGLSGQIIISGPSGGSAVVMTSGALTWKQTATALMLGGITCGNISAATYTSVRFNFSAGNISTGIIRVYGII